MSIALFVWFYLATLSQGNQPNGWNAFVDRIQQSVILGDVKVLAGCRDHLRSGLDADAPTDSGLRLYTLAYVDWRLAYLPGHEEMFSREELLKEAEHHLKKVIQAEPRNAEAYALLGAVYGGQITSNWKKLTIGRKAEGALERAVELEPENPRAVLNRAVAKFYKPRLFGGGKSKALRELDRAEKLFEREPDNRSWPNWGRIELETWRGFILAQMGDKQGARDAYQRALTLAPGHSRVLYLLLPAL
jgi:Flp pilus assembly protein TadD